MEVEGKATFLKTAEERAGCGCSKQQSWDSYGWGRSMSLNYKWDKRDRDRQTDIDREKAENRNKERKASLHCKSHHGVTEHTENQSPLQDQTGKNKFGLMFLVIGFKNDLLFTSLGYITLSDLQWGNLLMLPQSHKIKQTIPSLLLKYLEAVTSFEFFCLHAIFLPWHCTNV